ncbi:MAG TPA: hypothetical protein VIK78_01975 [Ruminiclostridium sp.]
MNSFALWFSSDSSASENFIADVHFNLWNMHYYKAMPPSLDIGIKIENASECNAINLFVPFKIDINKICDLGKSLKSSEILCNVFNEDYITSHQGGEKILKVNDSNSKPIMNIYCLDVQNDIKIEEKYDGTLLIINFPKTLRYIGLPSYFRFRIQSKCFNQIIKSYKPKNIFLQSAISAIEAIDFRFNDYRSLNPSLLEQMREGISYSIGKVHFLLLTEADVELQYSSMPSTARELEIKIWNGYFEDLCGKNIVAYHWKFKKEYDNKLIENCIMFVKTKVYKCNWLTIMMYIVSLGIFTIFFNYLSNLLF